jgi:hypothetical protein
MTDVTRISSVSNLYFMFLQESLQNLLTIEEFVLFVKEIEHFRMK